MCLISLGFLVPALGLVALDSGLSEALAAPVATKFDPAVTRMRQAVPLVPFLAHFCPDFLRKLLPISGFGNPERFVFGDFILLIPGG